MRAKNMFGDNDDHKELFFIDRMFWKEIKTMCCVTKYIENECSVFFQCFSQGGVKDNSDYARELKKGVKCKKIFYMIKTATSLCNFWSHLALSDGWTACKAPPQD